MGARTKRGHKVHHERIRDEIEMGIRPEPPKKAPYQEKTTVLGMVERGGAVVSTVIPKATTEHVKPVMTKMINVDSAVLITDKHPVYRNMDKVLPHETINHEIEYVRGAVHTQTIEGYWHNLTMRMSMRRFTRLTNAFSKKVQNHIYSVALYAVWFNFIRPHSSLKGETPAQAAGLAAGRLTMRQLIGLINTRAPKAKRGLYKTRTAAAWTGAHLHFCRSAGTSAMCTPLPNGYAPLEPRHAFPLTSCT